MAVEAIHYGEAGHAGEDSTAFMSGKLRMMVSKTWEESKMLLYIAGPAILTAVFEFSIGLVTVSFVGHLEKVELAAVSFAENVIEGFAFGVLLGMASALETLCGKAFGAGQVNMLGIYMQRSWVVTMISGMIISLFYIFTAPILKALRQSPDVSEMAGKYTMLIIPQLFAYAVNFPMQKFLQAQSKVVAMTVIEGVTLITHALLNWIFVVKLGYGLVGAAIVKNFSTWIINLAQMIYIISGKFANSWTGFSLAAFESLGSFARFSLASGVMLCLELWYFTSIILLVGLLKNSDVAVDAISICMSVEVWASTIALGFNVAVSVRVSNELGALHPKVAKFSVIVAVSISSFSHPDVIKETSKLANFLSAMVLLNSVQPVLSGVAIGAGWPSPVAYINIGCYYIIGLPIGALLGFKFNFGILGIWSGILLGCLLQTIVLLVVTARTNWKKEVLQAEEHLKEWGVVTPLLGEVASR